MKDQIAYFVSNQFLNDFQRNILNIQGKVGEIIQYSETFIVSGNFLATVL